MLIVDANSLLYAAYSVSTNLNQHWDFVSFIFLRSFVKNCRDLKSSPISVWDSGTPQWKIDLYPGYKQSRRLRKLDNSLAYARNYLQEKLPKIGISSISVKDLEADDIAYYLAEKLGGYLLSEDNDWLLNLKPGMSLIYPRSKKSISYEDIINEHRSMEAFLNLKALLGDKSDEIPGIITKSKIKNLDYSDESKISEFLGKDRFELFERNKKIMGYPWKFPKVITEEIDSKLSDVRFEPAHMLSIAKELNSDSILGYLEKNFLPLLGESDVESYYNCGRTLPRFQKL